MEGFQFLVSIVKQDGRFWGFAYVRPSSEKKVQASLRSMGISEYLPTLPKARMAHSTKIVTQIPMIPGYIFLCADDPERTMIKRSEERIVQLELLRDRYQEEVLIRELNALRQMEQQAQESPVLVNPGIVSGTEVLITAGPLKGLKTTVITRDDTNNSIIVNITILNRHIEYPVSMAYLKEITA